MGRIQPKRRKTVELNAAAAIALLWSNLAWAQEPQTPSAQEQASGTSEIIVTASRRAERLKDVPMTVDVATGEQIQKLNIFDFKDVQQLAPGLSLTNNDGRSNTATLRGIAYNPDSGAQPAVDIYFNEVPADPQTVFTAIYDIAQIEVLRGPQGVLRGRTSPAGSITISTRKPNLKEMEGYFQGTIGNHGTRNAQAAVSVPIVADKLALRVAGLLDGNDGNRVRAINRGDTSQGRTESVRASLAFEPVDAFNAVLTYQYLNARNRQYQQVVGTGNTPLGATVPSGPPATVRDRISPIEGPSEFKNRTHFVTLVANLDLGPATLSFNGGYQDTILDQTRDQDIGNALPGIEQPQTNRIGYKSKTAEIRVASNGEHFFNYSFGAFYQKLKNTVSVTQGGDQFFYIPALAFGGFNPFQVLPINVDVGGGGATISKSVFASARLNLTDRLKLEGGLRYSGFSASGITTLDISSPGNPFLATDPFVFPTSSVPNGYSYDPFTGGASLSFQVTPEITTYASYGHSFRPGVRANFVTTPGISESILQSPPETSDSIELGVKGDFFNRKISLNADIFYQKYKGYIDVAGCVTTSAAANGVADASCANINSSGDAVSKGVEVQLTARPIPEWDFGLSASYIDAHYKNAELYCNDYNGDGIPDSEGPANVPVGQQVATCASSDRIAEIPKFNLSLNTEYRFSMGDYQPFVRALFTYRPGFTSSRVQYRYPSYSLLNLFAGIRGQNDRWELTAFAKNVLNQRRISTISGGNAQYNLTVIPLAGAPTVGVADSGYRIASVTLPRELGATLRINF